MAGSSLIQKERRWRERPPALILADGKTARISLSLWAAGKVESPVEVSSDAVDDSHVISFAMQPTVSELHIGKATLKSGVVRARTTFVSGPIDKHCRSVLFHAFSFLQIHFPQVLMAECFEYAYGRPPSSDLMLFGPQYVRDDPIEHLVLALSNLDDEGSSLTSLFIDSVGLALAARLMELSRRAAPAQMEQQKPGLASWRLNRVFEYIEAHLAHPIRLGDLSEAAGLSRMHFAAQFRKSTGMSPHAYVTRRKIALVQDLLLDRSISVVDAALAAGFASQAHLSGIFKKIVGKTPYRWRNDILG